jgi:hypothetical protein
MASVAKYNLFKGISTLLGVGTPLITLFCTSKSFVYTPQGAISFTGVITLLLAALFLKDKIAENWKAPSVFIVACIIFVLVVMLEHIIAPIKWIALITMVTSGVDEVTFKRWYKRIEEALPETAKYHKVIGFLFTTTKTLEKESTNA